MVEGKISATKLNENANPLSASYAPEMSEPKPYQSLAAHFPAEVVHRIVQHLDFEYGIGSSTGGDKSYARDKAATVRDKELGGLTRVARGWTAL